MGLRLLLSLFSGLVEEDVSRLVRERWLGISLTKEALNCVWLNLLQGNMITGSGGTPCGYRVTTMVYLHNIVVKQQPVAMALDYGDVVSSVGATEEEREQNLLTAGDQCVSYPVSLTCHSALPLQ